MPTLEIRRHAEPATAGGAPDHLTAAGVAMARALRRDAERFALVISSPRQRAYDTAVAIAGRVDETAQPLTSSPDEALTQEQYDAMGSQDAVLELIGANPPSLRFAQDQLALWEATVRRMADGATALVITHGGNIELPAALLARRLGLAVEPLPLAHCEGVTVEYEDGRWSAIARLGAGVAVPTLAPGEISLGGNLSGSVRVGDTVRRRSGPWTPAVESLLAHLRSNGFTAAPQALGTDESGRTVLAWIPGETHGGWPEPMPAWMYEDEVTLIAAATLLQRYHAALKGFVPPLDASWRFVAPSKHEVICHNDWSPSNALFRDHLPVVMLDWDSAGPGSRAWDLASSAYRWVPLNPRDTVLSLAAKASRFARFCEAYGDGVARQEVFDTLTEQLPLQADFIQTQADAGDPGFAKLAGWGIPAVVRADAKVLIRQRDALCAGG